MASKKTKGKKPAVSDAAVPPHEGGPKIVGVDLGAVAKIVDSKVVQRVYSDALSKPLKETGGLATDIVRGLRLFTAPLVLAANWKDRLLADLEKCRKRVPEERQVESPPEIAGPILERLRFTETNNPLRDLFLNLLSTSIDSAVQSDAHPAFPVILGQLTADELRILMACKNESRAVEISSEIAIKAMDTRRFTTSVPMELSNSDMLRAYLGHLSGLGLISAQYEMKSNKNKSHYWSFITVGINPFGDSFLRACGVTDKEGKVRIDASSWKVPPK